jgi:tetratricopeptide (TPR) repeat protein
MQREDFMRGSLFACGLVLLSCGCASSVASAPPPRLTSAVVPRALYGRAHALDVAGKCDEAKAAYERYARAVRATDTASADLALRYAGMCRPHAHVDPVLTRAVTASLAGHDARALALLDADAEPSAWRDYDRGVALGALGRPDEAARAFDAAARAFGREDLRDRSIAIFGKARAYEDAHRCIEAADAYDEYAALVRASDPASAAMAKRYARTCAWYDFF